MPDGASKGGSSNAAGMTEIDATSLRRAPVKPGDTRVASRLKKALRGDVRFDRFTRGRYSTDASIYQIEPVGVVSPKDADDVLATLEIARDEGIPVLPRGGGTSQCGQTVGEAIVMDCARYMNRLEEWDPASQTARVQPGIVLDHLNKALKSDGLFFPVDVSTSSRATLGGMAGNNSCGSRSLRYGNMVHNVEAIDAISIDGERMRFAPLSGNLEEMDTQRGYGQIVETMTALAAREAEEIAARFPRVQRRVGGYNIDMVPLPGPAGGFVRSAGTEGIGTGHPWANRVGDNMASLLVGSEGTLAFFETIDLKLAKLPTHKTLGICHFPTFRAAMENTKHLVALGPAAVELVDSTLLGLARDIDIYRPIIETYVKGKPNALLLVEFAGDDPDTQLSDLKRLVELMGDLGFPDGVVEVIAPEQQKDVWEMRKACLNIAMSMKGDGKPVSFVEDCAVGLDDLADFTSRLTDVFHKHGTEGTWYAHASVGTLHVRPILNLKLDTGAKALRAIAEEAFEMVREYKGAHSGEHGDGIVRSEFHEPMFGARIARAFEDVKDAFDPRELLNPGKIVRPYRMDDRSLFRFKPDYRIEPLQSALDWSDWGGFNGAVEMCNNNGACRKSDPGVMCPSYRVTKEEKDLTRGRANSLRLAISGQLGPDAFTSEDMADTMALCVGCKGCKRECPTGVDMARMKIEFKHHYNKRHGLKLRERLVAYLPRYASIASKFDGLLGLRDTIPALAWLSEKTLGFSARRSLPKWHKAPFRADQEIPQLAADAELKKEVVLFADTFSTWFEPENARAALKVLQAAGYTVRHAAPQENNRPLCCGRTFLAAGLVEEARSEMRRTLDALAPFISRGVPVIGLEPSCVFTFRDEVQAILPNDDVAQKAARLCVSFEEFIARERDAGTLTLALKSGKADSIYVHGHCHQKAFGVMSAVETTLALIPDVALYKIDSSCCGMAGSFGYEVEHVDVSLQMAEASLLPAVREAPEDAIIAADGTSCRHQIADGTPREAVHVAQILAERLDTSTGQR